MFKQDQLHTFLEFSAEVTAFTVPELAGTGQAELYRKAVNDGAGSAALAALLDAYNGLVAGTASGPSERRRLLQNVIFADPKLGSVARAIVKLWYLGCWDGLPESWQSGYGPSLRPDSFVPAPAAYAEGLLWRAIGAHPPGAKAPGFASWITAPRIPSFADDPGPQSA